MIRVTFFSEGGELAGFQAEGHAGYADAGADIVCAAVSALLQTACGGVEEVAHVRARIERNDAKGYLALRLPEGMTPDQARDARLILKVASLGVTEVAGQYPKYVRIILRNGR